MVAKDGAFQMRKRVLYIGSSVPLETSEGLEAIQQPLKERYPVHDDHNIQGIDAFLSVLSGGLQLEYIQDPETVVWFPISSLTLCAAVRCIHIVNGATGEKLPKFVSLSNPAALGPNAKKPAIFSAITRRTTGKKVLECHGFVCSTPEEALELVQASKNAGYRNRHRGPAYHHIGGAGHTNGRPNNSVLRNESFSSRSSYNSPRPGNIRLVPGSSVSPKEEIPPEFFEPTPSQGYFYTGGANHVRSYTLSRVGDNSSQNPSYAGSEHGVSTLPTRPGRAFSPPPPNMSPVGISGRRPMRQPPPMPAHRRFFSPPPPPPPNRRYGYGLLNRTRDPYVFMPPPPIFVDSPYGMPVRPAVGRRGSVSSGESRSRSPSPRPNGETPGSHGRHRSSSGSSTLRRDGKSHHHHHHHHHTANGQGATESSSEVSSRPRTPPAEYATVNRMSRKDRYENQRYRKADRGHHHEDPMARSVYPGYYFYGYPPDSHYVRMARHQSLPPPMHMSPSRGRRVKKDKGKKKKKKKSKQHQYSDDVSTDSFENRSEIPAPMLDRSFPNLPRDWRRSQFKNEKALTKTILGGSRRGYFSDTAPTAYVLNQTRDGPHGELGFE